jgi:hypothetical protein
MACPMPQPGQLLIPAMLNKQIEFSVEFLSSKKSSTNADNQVNGCRKSFDLANIL